MGWYKGHYIPIQGLTEEEFKLKPFWGWRQQARLGFAIYDHTKTLYEAQQKRYEVLSYQQRLGVQTDQIGLTLRQVGLTLQRMLAHEAVGALGVTAGLQKVLGITPQSLLQKIDQFSVQDYGGLEHGTLFTEHYSISASFTAEHQFRQFIDLLFLLQTVSRKLGNIFRTPAGLLTKRGNEVAELWAKFRVNYMLLRKLWRAALQTNSLNALLPVEERQQLLKYYWAGIAHEAESAESPWIRAYGTDRYSAEYFKTDPYPFFSLFTFDVALFWQNYTKKIVHSAGSWGVRVWQLQQLFGKGVVRREAVRASLFHKKMCNRTVLLPNCNGNQSWAVGRAVCYGASTVMQRYVAHRLMIMEQEALRQWSCLPYSYKFSVMTGLSYMAVQWCTIGEYYRWWVIKHQLGVRRQRRPTVN